MITFLLWAYMVVFKYTILMRLFQLSLPKNVYKMKQKKVFSVWSLCAVSHLGFGFECITPHCTG